MTELPLADAILRNALQVLRLSAGEEQRVDAIMAELARELKDLVATGALNAAQTREVNAVIRQAEEIIDLAYRRAGASVDTHALAVIVAEKTQEIIQDVIPATVAIPTDAVLLQLGKDVLIDGAPSSAWWAKQSEDLAFKFAAQVRQGIANGETQERIVARITGRRGEPGIMDVSRRNARALVHTSVLTAANRARLETFRKNGRLIKGVRWLATLDSRTCLRCMALDGQAWDLDGEKLKGTKVEFTAAPLHMGCRCVLSPIPKTFKEIGLNIPEPDDVGQRASKDGPVAGDLTFQGFLSRQSPAFVENVLGKRRAELFLAGKLTVRDLVSGTGRELTLDELKTR